jgi:hypothetical protein
MALDVFPWGRTIGHSALLWALVAPIARGPRARAFVLGALSHLLADLADDAVAGLVQGGHLYSAWAAFPFATADDFELELRNGRQVDELPTTLELGTIATALFLAARRARMKRTRGCP